MKAPLFLGGGGRVAQLALSRWPGTPPIVLARRSAPDITAVWDMSSEITRPDFAADAVFDFSGVTPISGGRLTANTDLALASLRAARTWGARHVFVMSSSAVYGDTGLEPALETRAPTPVNPYGTAKAAMERAVLDVAADFKALGVTILRLANVAGAGQPFDAARVADGKAVTLHRFADGRGPSRSFVGPDTLARALAHLGCLAVRGVALPSVINVASQTPTAMADVLTALGQPFAWAEAPYGAIQNVHLDVHLLNALFPAGSMDGGDAQTLVSQVHTAQSGTIR